jgi:hypothetical protein
MSITGRALKKEKFEEKKKNNLEQVISMEHGLINYLDTKGKCRQLKACKGTLRQVFICLS